MDATQKHSINHAGLSSKFWATEQPRIYRTTDNVFRFYPESGVLSVSTLDFPDRVTGEPRIGKTVTVQIAALIESPETLEALLEILSAAQDKAERE